MLGDYNKNNRLKDKMFYSHEYFVFFMNVRNKQFTIVAYLNILVKSYLFISNLTCFRYEYRINL